MVATKEGTVKHARVLEAFQQSGVVATPARIKCYELTTERRVATIRAAVDQIVDASFDWSIEVADALIQLPEKERLGFIRQAGAAIDVLGGYVAAAAGR
jgi:hypothetical protein